MATNRHPPLLHKPRHEFPTEEFFIDISIKFYFNFIGNPDKYNRNMFIKQKKERKKRISYFTKNQATA
ncbi:MAG: hypothetical protein OIN86_13185 [Candidatus Methanoperedens sp.]|nr:hypothetical protein [Candidatus Methanoperedens sp.]CAG0949270.1 hypothetical protein METP1_00094 [Methanosarcinales archaeon]